MDLWEFRDREKTIEYLSQAAEQGYVRAEKYKPQKGLVITDILLE